MIIVTGGAGLIGSAVIWKLNQLGRDDILVVDHLGTGNKWKNLVPLRFTDYCEKDDFLEMMADGRLSSRLSMKGKKIEAVIHLGACSSTTEQDASYLVRNNFEYSKRMALFSLNAGARFVYASSAATYGDGNRGFRDDEASLHLLAPLNMYGYSKQLFDLWSLRNGLSDRIAGMKYFNVFGPNEYHKGDMRSVVLKAYEQIAATGEMVLFKSCRPDYADGEQLRDFIYVKDAVDMTLFLLDRSDINGIFNIGGGTARTWNALAAAIFSALEKPVNVRYIDMPEAIRPKYQYYTCADMAKIRAAGYDGICTTLEDAVADYLKNYLIPDKRLGE
jgi:ADP-L-glycero-D-manno-heptose 6-epimerase